jgi:nucleotidyltransferase/DNA polymerase involved in DNA repair
LSIARIDYDAFYATAEKRDRPARRDPPVIGGGRRGVMAAACYVARTFGIRCAMPMFQARRLCPHAVISPPDMDKYVRVGRQARQLMRELTPLVDPLSIDEAFMDLGGTPRLQSLSGQIVSSVCRARGDRHWHYGIDRVIDQQISGQDRLPSAQASRVCGVGRQRGSTLSGAQTSELHLVHGSGDAGAVDARWQHSYWGSCGHNRSRAQTPLWGRGRAPLTARPEP